MILMGSKGTHLVSIKPFDIFSSILVWLCEIIFCLYAVAWIRLTSPSVIINKARIGRRIWTAYALGTQKVFNVMHKVATRSFKHFKISNIVWIKMAFEKHANIPFLMTVNVEFLNVNVRLVILWKDVHRIQPKLAGCVIQSQLIVMSVRNVKRQTVIDIFVF